jgi:hypothetical protein
MEQCSIVVHVLYLSDDAISETEQDFGKSISSGALTDTHAKPVKIGQTHHRVRLCLLPNSATEPPTAMGKT